MPPRPQYAAIPNKASGGLRHRERGHLPGTIPVAEGARPEGRGAAGCLRRPQGTEGCDHSPLPRGVVATLPGPLCEEPPRHGWQRKAQGTRGGSARNLRHTGQTLRSRACLLCSREVANEGHEMVAEHIEECLSYSAFPESQRRRIRTTNGLERLNQEIHALVSSPYATVKSCYHLTLADPSLTLTRTQYPATVGNIRNRKPRTYTEFANLCNARRPLTAPRDKVVGQRFESARRLSRNMQRPGKPHTLGKGRTARSPRITWYRHLRPSTRDKYLHASVGSSWRPLLKARGCSRTHEATSR